MSTEDLVETLECMEQEILEVGIDSGWVPDHLNTQQIAFIAHMLGQAVSTLTFVRAMIIGPEELKNVSDRAYNAERIERILTAIKLAKES